MKLRSKGLGRKELVLDFRECEITMDGDEVLVQGTIREPVVWDFSIRIGQDDIPGMLAVGVNRNTLRLGARWLFRRKPKAGAEATQSIERQPTRMRVTAPPATEEHVARSVRAENDTIEKEILNG